MFNESQRSDSRVNRINPRQSAKPRIVIAMARTVLFRNIAEKSIVVTPPSLIATLFQHKEKDKEIRLRYWAIPKYWLGLWGCFDDEVSVTILTTH
jgi:hypothetical protein